MKNKFYQITNKSFAEMSVKTQKELWDKVKGDHKGLCAGVTAEFTKAEDMANRFNVVMSTATEDRHGDIVEQDWDVKFFNKNPSFIDSHNYDSIEHIIGKVHGAKVEDKKLQGSVEYALMNPKGQLAHDMTEAGFINAVSVGFIPKEFDDKGKILKSELLELSAVSVPANAEALFEKSIKEKKVEKKTEKKVEEKVEKIEKKLSVKENKRKEYLVEALAVIQQLNKRQVETRKRGQMVNRVIKQLIKAK